MRQLRIEISEQARLDLDFLRHMRDHSNVSKVIEELVAVAAEQARLWAVDRSPTQLGIKPLHREPIRPTPER